MYLAFSNTNYTKARLLPLLTSGIEFNIGEILPLRDKIASFIRDAIMDGRISPGERMQEPEVAKKLGVSRTPLREAFLQLESEGFVKVTPRRGAVVSELSVLDAEEIYVVKGALESSAARLAARSMNAEIIEKLSAINGQIASLASAKQKDYKTILSLNADFHSIINQASGNKRLMQMLAILRRQTLRYNYIYLSVLSHLHQSIKEHEQMIEAFRKQDAKKAEKLMLLHGETAGKALCKYIKSQQK